jgi:hypothetical protein
MKIYKVQIEMMSVIARLKRFNLEKYNSPCPVIFVEASDPDGACFAALHDLAQLMLKKDHSVESIKFVKDIMNDVRVIKVECPR